MVKLDETSLPGVGLRYDFDSRYGKRVGVITHRDGRREIFVARADDPDACAQSIVLADDEAEVVADLLGGSTVTRRMERSMQDIEGLAMDWVPLAPGSPFGGHRLGDTHLRSETGSSIVAVMRGAQAIPAPGPEFFLEDGDTVVVVGTAGGVRRAAALLSGVAAPSPT